LQNITNWEWHIFVTNFDFSAADLSRSLVDSIINEMWNRVRDTKDYRDRASKTVSLQGNNGYTGTYNGTTDWSGGLPTSPGAKAYDMKNNVTGTYNFATFQLT